MNLIKCPRCWGLGFQPPALILPCGYCAGHGKIEDVQLSPHFSFGEWCRAYDGCPNDPTQEAVARARLSLELLVEPARVALGVPLRVSSGYRCPELDVLADKGNRIWLTRLSAHALGSAFDLNGVDLRVLLKALRDNAKAAWDQLIAEAGCIHAALEGPDEHGRALPPAAGRRRKQILLRRLRTPQDGPGSSAYVYERFPDDLDDAAAWAKVV